ncbi:MAG: hypothetical protein HC880_17040 [Bacteroidia bacterium]|nr:hypothetical protein [Bacteroidia bacterium]
MNLLNSGQPHYQQRAFEVLATILAHQDTNPQRNTYGIWPYHLEEPLEKMITPDWNWADFIGVQLLDVYLNHREALPTQLREQVKEAIIHAARSIQKRDVQPGYTNIALMGAYVSYLTGYLFDLPDIQDYAEMRLKRFYDYTVRLGGFAEYNSPTYTRVALDELARMQQHILDPLAPRVEIDTFSREETPVIGYTYLHSAYALSSVNYSSTWQQRRPLLAYWGTSSQPQYLQCKLLHDFVDFAAGQIFSTQDKNQVLSILTFATDGGDYHISLDRLKEGAFIARDLRLRFELGSASLYDKIQLHQQGFSVQDEFVHFQVMMPHTQFDDYPITIKKGKDERHCWVDWVIYTGAEKSFKLTEVSHAAFAWLLTFHNQKEKISSQDLKTRLVEDVLKISSGALSLSIPYRPDTEASLRRQAHYAPGK